MMLPDDYENTAQSVVATNFFGNNVLAAITTSDYWDVGNEYKPLMQTWYVGVLMQYYVLVAVLCFVAEKVTGDMEQRKSFFMYSILALGCVSLVVYFISSPVERFYYLPSRFFEFSCGSAVYYIVSRNRLPFNDSRTVGYLFHVLNVLLLVIVLNNVEGVFMSVLLITTVLCTALLLLLSSKMQLANSKVYANKWVAFVGAGSFSIFVWHQVVFAFTRYSFTKDMLEPMALLPVFALIVVFSVLSYKYVEKMKETKIVWGTLCFTLLLSTGVSLYVYSIAGVVRDVPELDVAKGNSHRGMWAEYNERGTLYDKDFTYSSKPKWYVIGNSFGRDLVNIIAESDISENVELSFSGLNTYSTESRRFSEADVVFISTLGLKEELVETVKSLCNPHAKLYIFGEKNFGESNGQVYSHRFSKDYHKMTIPMEDGYDEKNKKYKALYGDIYIDLISYVQQPDGKVRVFSDDGRFLSQDCRHLTKAGAQFYAKCIDWDRFFSETSPK